VLKYEKDERKYVMLEKILFIYICLCRVITIFKALLANILVSGYDLFTIVILICGINDFPFYRRIFNKMYEESKQLLLAIFLEQNLSFLNIRKYSKNSEIIHAFVLQFVYVLARRVLTYNMVDLTVPLV